MMSRDQPPQGPVLPTAAIEASGGPTQAVAFAEKMAGGHDEEVDGSCQHQFVAEWDDEGVYFYQAFNDEIADSAIEHQKFGGPKFNPDRMTWIKPSFAWMLYRAGYGLKDKNQSRVLRVKLSHEAAATILAACP